MFIHLFLFTIPTYNMCYVLKFSMLNRMNQKQNWK